LCPAGLDHFTALLLDSTQLQEWISDTLNELEQDVQADHCWAKLWLVVDGLPFYPAINDKLIALLQEIHLVALYQMRPSVVPMAFRFLADQCLFIQDSDLRRRIEEQVSGIAGLAAKKYALSQNPPDEKEKAEAENLADLLVRCAVNLTVGEDEANFCGGKRLLPLQRLFEAWPEHYSDVQNGFWRVLRGLPVQESWKAWPAYLALRAMR
jgi:hypothetical protein